MNKNLVAQVGRRVARAGSNASVGAMALALLSSAVSAQTASRITKDESMVRVSIPSMPQARETYLTAQAANFSRQDYVAILVGRGGDLPRAEVVFTQLLQGYNFQTRPAFDIEEVRKRSGFLKGKAFADVQAVAAEAGGDRRTLRFKLDGADCFAFDMLPDGLGTATGVQRSEGKTRVAGYFCSAPGRALGPEAPGRVLAGIEINARDAPGWRSIGR